MNRVDRVQRAKTPKNTKTTNADSSDAEAAVAFNVNEPTHRIYLAKFGLLAYSELRRDETDEKRETYKPDCELIRAAKEVSSRTFFVVNSEWPAGLLTPPRSDTVASTVCTRLAFARTLVARANSFLRRRHGAFQVNVGVISPQWAMLFSACCVCTR